MCRWLPGLLGYPETDSPLPFPTGRVDRSPPAVPCRFHDRLSSHRLHVFFREHIRELPPVASQPESRSPPNDASLEVRDPSSRHKPMVSTECAGVPGPTLSSVLDVSHVLDGLLHHRPRGFVSPHSRVQGFPSRVFPFQRSRTGLLQPLPSCRSASPPCSCLLQTTMPRLQGFAPRGSPLTKTGGLDPSPSRDPHGILPLQVFTRHAVGTPSRPFRPWPSLRGTPRRRPSTSHQRIHLADLDRDRPPCPRFLT